jgi:hypothetical protein
MADTYTTLADFLQGRSRPAPYTAPTSEFTTPEDLRRERISSALGWDVGRPLEEFVGRALPLALGAVRAPVAPRMAPAAPASPAAPAAPQGPWEPGFMTQWLRGRYQPAARPQPWQADRRWGTAGQPQPTGWDKASQIWNRQMYGDLGRPPRTPGEAANWLGRHVVPHAVAGGTAASAGQFGFNTLYHGEPWETASWRALIGPHAGQPPSWWPQPPAEQRPPPAGPQPQPPSRCRGCRDSRC